jgi:DivIVA domain-containing protein
VARKRKKKETEQREPDSGLADADVATPEERSRLTPVDIQQKVFRLAFRGYNERDVDEFLDGVTEDLAALHEENKRLREQIAEGGGSPDGVEEAQRQAETIVRQAREHAARLVEDAERRPAVTEAVTGGLPPSFLLQERGFLQQMAALIQDHARRLKEEARRARATSEEPPEQATAPEEAPQAESSPPPEEPPSALSGGGVVAGAAAAAAASESPGIEEATAPWSTVDPEPEPEPGGTSEASAPDPLLSAWESAFTGEETEGDRSGEEALSAYPSDPRRRKDDEEGEPSLRELFWGEE